MRLLRAGWPGRLARLGLVLLILGVSLCLFDGDETDAAGHVAGVDLCNGLALASLMNTLLALAAAGPISSRAAELVHILSIRLLDPPPRPLLA
ncbi:MAG TPA: hypothetical protein VLK35_16125 [Methylomirabilota bacterium]|nr:hypothetical protein [Methylomirabilota bacterium]